MITAGIIAEYNPFHRGHQYHIEETRRQTGADYVIVAMSGCYVQRGEPAIVDKYLRTHMALSGGADLVIEIPVIYATASAEFFATAGVKLFHHLHCVDYLSFGSENAEIKDFYPLVKILSEESPFFQQKLKQELKMGKNFPLAREAALRDCVKKEYAQEHILWEIVTKPNHILGLEYLKCLERLGSNIVPLAIKRQGAQYHDLDFMKEYPSASAIRKMLTTEEYKQQLETLLYNAMGEAAVSLFSHWKKGDTICWEELMPFLDYAVLMEENNPADFFGFDRDMAARFRKYYQPGCTFASLLESLHTKRLTDATWRRALLHRILQIEKEDFLLQASEIPVPYARILGFSKKAAPLLKKMREKADIPVIQKAVQGKVFEKESAASKLFSADIRAAQLYEQIAAAKCQRAPISEWVRQQIIY